jgi:site-specific DNA-methyltransferase (adenine-specific)
VEINKIYNESCQETLKKFQDSSIDHCITSPPYNMNLRVTGNKYHSRQIVKEFSTKYNGFNDNLPQEEYFQLHKEILKEMLRVTKGYIFYNIQVVTGNKPSVFRLMGEFHNQIKELIIWDKDVAQPAMQSMVMNSQFELIIVLSNNSPITRQFKDANFSRGTLSNLWRIKRGKKISKDHGAIFPEELIEKIVTNFTKENDLIYDPFFGTGTVGFVAKKFNRNYLGSELSTNYCNIAETRIGASKFFEE